MITKLTVALLGVLMLFAPVPSAEPWPRWADHCVKCLAIAEYAGHTRLHLRQTRVGH